MRCVIQTYCLVDLKLRQVTLKLCRCSFSWVCWLHTMCSSLKFKTCQLENQETLKGLSALLYYYSRNCFPFSCFSASASLFPFACSWTVCRHFTTLAETSSLILICAKPPGIASGLCMKYLYIRFTLLVMSTIQESPRVKENQDHHICSVSTTTSWGYLGFSPSGWDGERVATNTQQGTIPPNKHNRASVQCIQGGKLYNASPYK